MGANATTGLCSGIRLFELSGNLYQFDDIGVASTLDAQHDDGLIDGIAFGIKENTSTDSLVRRDGAPAQRCKGITHRLPRQRPLHIGGRFRDYRHSIMRQDYVITRRERIDFCHRPNLLDAYPDRETHWLLALRVYQK